MKSDYSWSFISTIFAQLALGLALTAALAIPAVSQAQTVMTASDSLGNSSFNSAGNWSPAGAPSAGNNYSTAGYLLRSPASGSAYTFAGTSLTVGGGLTPASGIAFSPVTANNNALIFKVASQTLTVNSLILNAGQIRDGNGSGQWAALNGNIFVTANGGAFIAQDTNIINSAISGHGPLYIGDNGSGDAGRVIVLTSPSSIYSGSIMLTNTHNSVNYSRLDFAPNSVMNFVIQNNGVNNRIFGQGTLELGGVFDFNLSLADNTVGDSWSIVDQVNSSVTYDPTFSVSGFTQNGPTWLEVANSVTYVYDTQNGTLSVIPIPEPSTWAMFGLGLAGLLALRRRK